MHLALILSGFEEVFEYVIDTARIGAGEIEIEVGVAIGIDVWAAVESAEALEAWTWAGAC